MTKETKAKIKAISKEKIPRTKMPIEQRAKQFMPFAALNGLYEALEQKAWEVETRQAIKDKIWYNEEEE